eukprot:XP_011603398.1 PREDICTED: somatostatin receptor type 5-like [Takifugu rubripes]
MPQQCHRALCLSVYIITFILGLPMNILAFYTFCKKVRQKPTPIDILLLNLTISDLLFLIFLPFKMQEVMNNMIWNLPYALCPLSGFIFYMTIYNSTFCLTAVSVERYLGVAFPIQHTLKRRPVYAVAACIFFWIFSFINLSIVVIIPFIGSEESLSNTSNHNDSTRICYENFTDTQLNILLPVRLELFVVLFCIPFIICCFCYINFIRVLSRLHNIDRRRRLRAIGMALGTLIVFAVCFGPYNISHVVGFVMWKSPEWRDKALLCSTFNACLDPFIFYMSSSAVRGTVGSMMKGFRCRFGGCVPSHVFCTFPGERAEASDQFTADACTPAPEERSGCLENQAPGTFCLTAVSVERYLSVTFPIQHRLKSRPVYAVAACIFFWIFSFINLSIVSIMPFIVPKGSLSHTSHHNDSTRVCYENFTDAQLSVLLPVRLELFVVLFCIPFIICCFCYINFIWVLFRLHNIDRWRRLRIIGMASGTLTVFAVCFGPYNISHVVGFVTWKSPEWRDKALLCSTFHACLEPFIFYMASSAVRETVGSMVKGFRCRFSGCVPGHVFCNSSRSITMTATDKEHNQEQINGSGKEAATSCLQ